MLTRRGSRLNKRQNSIENREQKSTFLWGVITINTPISPISYITIPLTTILLLIYNFQIKDPVQTEDQS